MSIPALVSPVVATIDASASMRAVCPSNDRPACAQAARRDRLIASCNAMVVSASKRRQKSPAVVGSGRLSTPTASKNTASLRRASMSSRRTPPQSALMAMFNT